MAELLVAPCGSAWARRREVHRRDRSIQQAPRGSAHRVGRPRRFARARANATAQRQRRADRPPVVAESEFVLRPPRDSPSLAGVALRTSAQPNAVDRRTRIRLQYRVTIAWTLRSDGPGQEKRSICASLAVQAFWEGEAPANPHAEHWLVRGSAGASPSRSLIGSGRFAARDRCASRRRARRLRCRRGSRRGPTGHRARMPLR